MLRGEVRWIAILFLPLCVSCQCIPTHRETIHFDQAPPTVRAVLVLDYPGIYIQRIEREFLSHQYFYDVSFFDSKQGSYTVVLNEAGDRIDGH